MSIPAPRRVSQPDALVETLVSLAKRRGFIFQSSEIYGGINAIYDFGPLGLALKRNIRQLWWRHMVELRHDVARVDGPELVLDLVTTHFVRSDIHGEEVLICLA